MIDRRQRGCTFRDNPKVDKQLEGRYRYSKKIEVVFVKTVFKPKKESCSCFTALPIDWAETVPPSGHGAV